MLWWVLRKDCGDEKTIFNKIYLTEKVFIKAAQSYLVSQPEVLNAFNRRLKPLVVIKTVFKFNLQQSSNSNSKHFAGQVKCFKFAINWRWVVIVVVGGIWGLARSLSIGGGAYLECILGEFD